MRRPSYSVPAPILALGIGLVAVACAGKSCRGSSDVSAGAAQDGDARSVVVARPVNPFIVIDQFGYRPSAEKIAVIRSPRVGFDAKTSFTPGPIYALIDTHSKSTVLEAAPAVWHDGAIDASSGDKAWWFDFSSVTTPGDYFVLDEAQNVRSPTIHISDDAFRTVLVQAARMLYYQRDGIAKDARHAGADWADGMAHPQDVRCRLYADGSAPRNLRGGWFDAGDQNTYTNLSATYAIELFRAYTENVGAFTDDYDIPESGNGVPDILDEIKWDLDWIGRMQGDDGSVLSIKSHSGASPPSSDTKPCTYGPASTSATLTSAAAFAYGSMVFESVPAIRRAYPGYADNLAGRAKKAWIWAVANPSVTFFNAKNGVGGGEQEVDGNGRLQKLAQAAAFLFELTGDAAYRSAFDANYAHLLSPIDPFHVEQLDTALEYTKAANATASVASNILSVYKANVEEAAYFGRLRSAADPYLAYLQTYTWGSNQVKAAQGNMFANVVTFKVDGAANAEAMRYAERYVHYLHGVNPLGLVYLSNMGGFGAEKFATRFFHTWFANGSRWDATGVSKYGPPPGYLVGGPNPAYDWDSCCPSRCGGNNARCGSAAPSPPKGQPDQKSYKDFNNGWPLDSWTISEPDVGYQVKYIRLLSKFVR